MDKTSWVNGMYFKTRHGRIGIFVSHHDNPTAWSDCSVIFHECVYSQGWDSKELTPISDEEYHLLVALKSIRGDVNENKRR